ncbi:MAG: ADP-ribosylglycohydrolase family protein [Verrucomicrobia bacterium]|nr:ADP-ribosylglycohydrolase family protein [Verrucomicrobiota bacterium]
MPITTDRQRNSLLGAFLGDALAMPAHWYYDRAALASDYGRITALTAPKNPHPDSILWRSSYTAPNPKGEILHSQAQYWGRRGIHYHQFLPAGGNTLNMLLALELLDSLRSCGGYDHVDYLRRYIDFMTTPDRHRDTYIEECHRNFFTNFARGKKPEDCGATDIHIGGLAHVPILAAWFADNESAALEAIHAHIRTTHRGPEVETAARDLAKMLIATLNGAPLRESIEKFANGRVGPRKLRDWSKRPDHEIVGGVFSPACYLEDSFPASLFLAWKYADDPKSALIANTNLGGDNCHRGIVVGALTGATGIPFPQEWTSGLVCRDQLG